MLSKKKKKLLSGQHGVRRFHQDFLPPCNSQRDWGFLAPTGLAQGRWANATVKGLCLLVGVRPKLGTIMESPYSAQIHRVQDSKNNEVIRHKKTGGQAKWKGEKISFLSQERERPSKVCKTYAANTLFFLFYLVTTHQYNRGQTQFSGGRLHYTC